MFFDVPAIWLIRSWHHLGSDAPVLPELMVDGVEMSGLHHLRISILLGCLCFVIGLKSFCHILPSRNLLLLDTCSVSLSTVVELCSVLFSHVGVE